VDGCSSRQGAYACGDLRLLDLLLGFCSGLRRVQWKELACASTIVAYVTVQAERLLVMQNYEECQKSAACAV
jgi:hypothetical protein